MTSNELNIIRIMTLVVSLSQSILNGVKDISEVSCCDGGVVIDTNNDNKIVASYIPEHKRILEYWEDVYDNISCRVEVNRSTNEKYISIFIISDEGEEFEIEIDSNGRIS